MSDKELNTNYKLDIVFYVDGMPFDGDTIKKASLGGSETMGLLLARELSKLGHSVTVFSHCDKNGCKPGLYDGVMYRSIQEFFNYMILSSCDVCIVQRAPHVFNVKTKAKLNILWQHDLALKRNRPMIKGALWNIDEIWGLTDFHINQMSETLQIPKYTFWKTRNGIEPVKLNKNIKRHPKRLIYTARPERGMDILLNNIMPRLWRYDKDIELILAGYDNTVPQMQGFYDALYNRITEYQKAGFKVKHLGALTKQQLYKEYQKASLYVYPTNFEEISCITAMECMACGLPMVTTNLGALTETLSDDCAVLINDNANSSQYHEHFTNTIRQLLANDKMRYNYCHDSSLERSKQFHISKLAQEWEHRFYNLFQHRIMNEEALARQFYRNEDIMAIKHLNIPHWNKKIDAEYPIIDNPKAYHHLYEDYGRRFRAKFESGLLDMTITPYKRVTEAMAMMKKPKKILDFGCAIGNEAIQFVNEFGCRVYSVNISQDEMEVGRQLADKYCKHPENIIWIKGDSPDCVNEDNFDVVFGGEILEHVPDPHNLVDALEKKCKQGGQMIFTVPLGPWGDTYEYLEQKGHLYSFDRADIKDLIGRKKNLTVKVISGSINSKNKEMLGWYLMGYTKDNSPTGQIDLSRKRVIQAPRQTLSVCMIIGGEQEGLLHRCLKSIQYIADEIIIADCGMSMESRRIVKKYDVKIVEGVNPLRHGFDEARNISISHATGDWILWIDADEELLAPENLLKYLRYNHLNGYSIRQHHFSAQPPNAFKPDLPVRIFRNNKGIKFFGVVHEHPELDLNKSVGDSTILSDIDLAHDGYLTEEIRRKRFDRNFQLMLADRKKYPERILGKFLMMRDWMHLARYRLEQTKGQVTQEIAEYCEKVVKSYRENFMNKDTMMSHDGLAYYSEALGVLGRGMEYAFNFNVSPKDVKLEEKDIKARFETSEDFINFVSSKISTKSEMFTGQYA